MEAFPPLVSSEPELRWIPGGSRPCDRQGAFFWKEAPTDVPLEGSEAKFPRNNYADWRSCGAYIAPDEKEFSTHV
jgi:hypothetical protein